MLGMQKCETVSKSTNRRSDHRHIRANLIQIISVSLSDIGKCMFSKPMILKYILHRFTFKFKFINQSSLYFRVEKALAVG